MYNVARNRELRVTTIFTRIRNNEIINRIETDEEENATRKDCPTVEPESLSRWNERNDKNQFLSRPRHELFAK